MSHGAYAASRERRDSFWSASESEEEDLTNSCSASSANVTTEQDEVTNDVKMQESSGVLRSMIDVEKLIHEYASVSLSDLMLGYEDEDGKRHNRPSSRFRNTAHRLNPTTSTGVTRNIILGLYELVQSKFRDDSSERKVFEHLDSNTFSFNTTPRMWENASENPSGSQFKDAKGSRTYVFVAALKFFIAKLFNASDGLTPDTFCTLNRLLSSTNEDRGIKWISPSKWYIILSDDCHCEEGAHSWLNTFIDRINKYNQITKLDPIYEISRLYLAFVWANYFGKHSREMGMILIQTLALKWMHYVSIPFDEKEKEFQDIIMIRSNTTVPRLAQFLEKSFVRNIERILLRLSGTSFHVEDLNTEPVIEVTKASVTVGSKDTNDIISHNSNARISNTGLLLKRVSSKLESIMEPQRLDSGDSLAEQKTVISIGSPALQFQIPTPKCCKTPHYRQEPPPARRNSCENYSNNWLWADQSDVCAWNLGHEDLSDSPGLAPTMRKQFGHTEMFKRGSMDSLTQAGASSEDGDDDSDSQLETHVSTQNPLRSPNSDPPFRSRSLKIHSSKQSLAPEDSNHPSPITINASQNLRMHSQRYANFNNSAFSLFEHEATTSRVSPMLVKRMTNCSLNSP
ncbi:hypothetical protein EYC84_006172 [Monilinia fructicola]|uniref:Uncharacterized protein n=1 Tax=Monilinia fructicola TaxID=38448 RepID=A0A5M9K6A8_MONFR|nr:hypothetical protein EYC84_006172 [Monilinia fructicola]